MRFMLRSSLLVSIILICCLLAHWSLGSVIAASILGVLLLCIVATQCCLWIIRTPWQTLKNTAIWTAYFLIGTVLLAAVGVSLTAATGGAGWILYIIGGLLGLCLLGGILLLAIEGWTRVYDRGFERHQNTPLHKAGIDPADYWTQVRYNKATKQYEVVSLPTVGVVRRDPVTAPVTALPRVEHERRSSNYVTA